MISSILHTFDISAPTDKDGKPVKIEVKMTNGVVSYVNIDVSRVLHSRRTSTAIPNHSSALFNPARPLRKL